MYDVIIIGAGPAGASAGLFTAKAGKKTLIVDNDKSITKRAWMENHYGVAEISGPDMVETGKNQVKKFGGEIIQGEAVNITKSGDELVVETDQGEFKAKHVVLATGMSVALGEKAGVKTKPGTEPRVKAIYDVDADGKTNIDGVWAAGTCAGVSMHTIITAGDGGKVGINIVSELNGERYVDHDIMK